MMHTISCLNIRVTIGCTVRSLDGSSSSAPGLRVINTASLIQLFDPLQLIFRFIVSSGPVDWHKMFDINNHGYIFYSEAKWFLYG